MASPGDAYVLRGSGQHHVGDAIPPSPIGKRVARYSSICVEQRLFPGLELAIFVTIGLVHQSLQDGSLKPLMEPGGETRSGQNLAFSQVVGSASSQD
ncbi:hypothetical protein HW05_31765 [Pseudomonas aeruginosa]|nr:hypothetical protein HW05_31765 [Pseudomonas aeruginosa]